MKRNFQLYIIAHMRLLHRVRSRELVSENKEIERRSYWVATGLA